MSAGLMSCVRENSPPLENTSGVAVQVQDIPITITTPETAVPATDTTKRKRFHPLRNLRRIFRRRTVSSADRAPGQLGAKGSSPTHIHFATPPGCSTTDATLPRTGFGVPITIRSGGDSAAGTSQHHHHHYHHQQQQQVGAPGGGIGGYFKRETYRLRNSDDLDKEMSDYQRSLSEGRLVDSDISRDGLSQSHDSVFSESAGTASSLSITLKNELADVLRKRRKDRQGEVSDEDLGLPLSPITPQRKDRGMNKSEGSLSILSMTSSDLDLDERSTSNASGHNLLHLDSSASGHSIGLNRSDNMDESGDSSKLSHSAAKHKLAVRPKKKGPTRARTRPTRETTLLPATPEVNEDSLKLSTCNIADLPKGEAEEKAHSLPYVGVMPIVMTPASPGTPAAVAASSSTTELTTSSSIYVNKTLSKSHQEFDGAGGATRKDDDGFFKRILNYSFKKKKHEKEETVGSPKREENTSSVYITPSEAEPVAGEQLMKLSLVVGDADGVGEQQLASGYRKIKSGPAARQRIFPKDIYGSGEEQHHQHHQRYSSNVEVNRQSVASSSGSGHSLLAVAGEGGRGPLHKSEEYLSSAKVRKFSERSVDEGGEGDDEESDGLRKYVSHGEGARVKSAGAKVYGLSAYQQKLAKMSVTQQQQQQQQQQETSPSKRKAVEKSKSFRTYTDSVSNNLQQTGGSGGSAGNGTAHGHQLPSLPNLSSSLSVGNFSTNNFLETEHKFFSMTENMNAGKQRVFKDYISNAGDDGDGGGGDGRMLLTSSASLQKFEINDNNLLNPREEYYDHQPKSIVLTTNTLTPPEPTSSSILHKSNQNISQIEETIDKLVSSQFVSIIRSSDSDGSSTERLDDVGGHVPEFMKIQLNRVEGATSGRSGPPPPKLSTNVVLTTSPTPVPPTSPAIDRSPPTEPDMVRMRRFSNENIEITESKPPLPPSAVVAARSSLDAGGASRSPPAFRKQSSGGGGSGDVPGSKRNSMNLSQELSDDRKVILQRRTSVTEEKIKYERRISSSSEDIKYEKRKSTSEEVLEKQPRAGPAGGGGVNSSYTSGSSSGDELVVLRKKFVVDREGRREKDSTPELMKVFARRSLKLRSDDDYKVVSTGDGGLEGKSMCSIDSDKENQSSEEKLDKVGVVKHHHQQQQQQETPTSLSGPPSSNGSMSSTASVTAAKGCPELGNKNGVTTTTMAPVSSESSAGGEPIVRKNTTSKPFGVPNRFSNLANGQSGRNATSFIDVRKTLLPPTGGPGASANNNNNNNGKSATSNNGEPGGDGPPSSVNNNNNNNNHHHHHHASNNRHTIASLNQLNSAGGGGGGVVVIANNNLVPTIEAIGGGVGGGGEINEFKGILQRRAEWEKRAKEGFK